MTTTTNEICGKTIQIDRSGGQGHCWRNADEIELPANVAEEIACEILDGKQESCGDYVASNGQHYRW